MTQPLISRALRRWTTKALVLFVCSTAAASPSTAFATETSTYTYDALGRLTAVARSGGPNSGAQVNTSFDANDNRMSHGSSGGVGGLSLEQSEPVTEASPTAPASEPAVDSIAPPGEATSPDNTVSSTESAAAPDATIVPAVSEPSADSVSPSCEEASPDSTVSSDEFAPAPDSSSATESEVAGASSEPTVTDNTPDGQATSSSGSEDPVADASAPSNE